VKFEWDEKKNQSNVKKHGVNFSEAVYVFSDHFALNILDDEHSQNEERWILLGKSLHESVLLIVHTYRDGNSIRIISARKSTKNEQKIYEKRCQK
jgi:hypothetical protein